MIAGEEEEGEEKAVKCSLLCGFEVKKGEDMYRKHSRLKEDDYDDGGMTDKNLFKLCGLAFLILTVPFGVFGVAHFVGKLSGVVSGILAIVSVIVFVVIGVSIAIKDSRVPSVPKYQHSSPPTSPSINNNKEIDPKIVHLSPSEHNAHLLIRVTLPRQL